jgi:hypothetical protein
MLNLLMSKQEIPTRTLKVYIEVPCVSQLSMTLFSAHTQLLQNVNTSIYRTDQEFREKA